MRLLAIPLALICFFALATLVSGHAAPERFDPAPGVVLEEAPARVDGFFTQDVRRQEGASFIQVLNADGERVDSGQPVIYDNDRRHMYVELESGLGEGRYLVAWQTLFDEDDELDGSCFLFFVGQGAADAAHDERVRIDDPEGCTIDLEEATSLLGAPEDEGEAHEEGENGVVQEGEEAHEEEGERSEPTSEDGDDGVPVGALIGGIIGAAAAGLVVGGGVALLTTRRRN